jgi:hypothetical protein
MKIVTYGFERKNPFWSKYSIYHDYCGFFLNNENIFLTGLPCQSFLYYYFYGKE